MKYLKLISLLIFFLTFTNPAKGQFLKKLAKKAEDKIEREAERRSERRVNKKIDEGFDEIEDEIDGKNKDKKKGKSKQDSGNDSKDSEVNSESGSDNQDSNKDSETDAESDETSTKPNVVWNHFDFVPGDTVIFEDGPSTDEENGEFPSRWDLYKGGAEIAEVDGVPVITFITAVGNMHSKGIVPYLKNPEQDYLPEIFTIEFDAYFEPEVYNWRYYLSFNDRKNQEYFRGGQLSIYVNSIRMAESEGELKDKSRGNIDEVGGWRHISIAYTKGKFKAYLQDQRLINIPHLEGNPTGITLSGDEEGMYVKNFRIAKGGVKYYDKVVTDGKIIVNGIKFDVNKATLKPESMGPINRIFKLMQKNPDIKFSVEGHTDSDGSNEANMTLSKARGKAVMDKLISMGIDKSRLKYDGFGESKPIDNNSTPEGKANNRRVEFVKF